MSERGRFEDQLRAKLESFEAPYEPAHWAAYRQKYGPAGGGHWGKIWYLPYLFSALLFGLAWYWWGGSGAQKFPPESALSRIDTVYLQQTIRVYDTLVIRDTVYLQPMLPVRSAREAPRRQRLAQQEPREEAVLRRQTQRQQDRRHSLHLGQDKLGREAGTEENTPSADWRPQGMSQRVAQWREQQASRKALDSSGTAAFSERGASRPDSLGRKAADPDSLALANTAEARARAADSGELDRTEKQQEALAGLKERLQGADFRLMLGPETRLFSPFSSGEFDTYGGVFGGLGLRLGLQRWELQAAFHYGFMQHEFRDPLSLSPGRLAQFPIYRSLSPRPDYIEIWTQQFLLPLSLSYSPWTRGAWAWRIEAGALGNYLVRENFEYSYRDENLDDIEDLASGFENQGFQFSHLSLGTAFSYAPRQRWRLEAGLSYYQALDVQWGLSGLDPSALSLNMAWYYRLGR